MSEVAASIGSADQCRSLVRHCEFGAGEQSFTGGLYLGSINRLLGRLHDRLGNHHEADGYFVLAVGEATVLRSPTWLARTHLDMAESRLVRARFTDAQVSLDAARATLTGFDLPASTTRLATLTERARTAR